MGPKIVVHTDHVISIECHMYACISTWHCWNIHFWRCHFCPQQVQKWCLFRIADLEAGLFLTKDPKKNHSDPWQDLTFEQDTIDVWHITYVASECFRSICPAYNHMLSLCAFPPLEPLKAPRWCERTISREICRAARAPCWRSAASSNPHLINQCLFHSGGYPEKVINCYYMWAPLPPRKKQDRGLLIWSWHL